MLAGGRAAPLPSVALLTLLLGLLAGCGSNSAESPGATDAATAPSTASATTTSAPTESDEQASEPTSAAVAAETDEPAGDLTPEDAATIEQLLKTWDMEGGCELMTDKFLEDQTFSSDRKTGCALHEQSVVPKQYTEDDILISNVRGTGEKAKATLGSTISDLTVTFTLVNVDGSWLIDGVDF